MKKILIMSHAMEIGGVETALLGLLENIDTRRYEVDLFLMRHSGELMRHIPSNINLLPELPAYASLAVPVSNVIRRGQFKVALARAVGKYRAKKRVKELNLSADNAVELEYSHKYTVKAMPYISNVQYDATISFLTPHYFLVEKVHAKKKIAWIHTDYSVVKVDTESEVKMWSKFDHIISISDDVTKSFLKVFPSLKSHITVIENIMPMKYIKKLANESFMNKEMAEDGSIKFLSIGRFTGAKKFDEIPEICRKIREKGLNVKWYLIGYGGEENLIRQKIAEQHMENDVFILGKKENPYPYIKACDFYLQPSRYEGKSVAVREAQILNKPVIITNYATAQSQLKNGYDGVIVPMDTSGCAEGIANVIRDKELQHTLIGNTKKSDYTNVKEIEKLYLLLEER